MWLLTQLQDSFRPPSDVCDPCSTSICEEIRRVRSKTPGKKNCRVCHGFNPGKRKCQSQLIASFSSHNDLVSCEQYGCNEDPKFKAPVGCDNLTNPVGFLWAVRNELANFQCSQGISREQYGFYHLIKDLFFKVLSTFGAICELGQSCLCRMGCSFFPMFWIICSVFRFSIDSILAVTLESNANLRIRKSVIFVIQLVVSIIIIQYTVGILLLPLCKTLNGLVGSFI